MKCHLKLHIDINININIIRSRRYAWHKMRPIVTNVPWSVCVSVCLLDIIIGGGKTSKPIEMPFGVWCGLGWSQGTMY